MPSRRQPRAKPASRSRQTAAPRPASLPVSIALAGFIEALASYWNDNAKANKAKNARLIETLAATFPHIEFFRLAATDPVVRKMLDDLTAPQFAEVIGPYLSELLPALSPEQINAFAAKVFQGMEPEHLRRLLPHAARAVQTGLAFFHLLPALVTDHPQGELLTWKIGTASVPLGPATLNAYRARLLQLAGLSSAEAEALGPDGFSMRLVKAMVAGRGSPEWHQALEDARLMVGKKGLQGIAPDTQAQLAQLFQPKSASAPAPAFSTIPPPKTETNERTVIEQDDRILTKPDGRYFPIALAAERAQVPRTTLLNWINAKIEFQGRPLEVYKSASAHKSFLSEESVQRVANRFVKWPSQEPAGPVTVGETKDKTGYIPISRAASALGVDHHTIWLWTARQNAPLPEPLDVIKCAASEQFYVREREIPKLKKAVPRQGLRPGRRPHLLPT